MTIRLALAAGASLVLMMGTALADSHDCTLSYEVFEGSVPHTDMEECPQSLEAGDDAFCRVAVLAEVATVFVFSFENGCLMQARNYFEDEFTFEID